MRTILVMCAALLFPAVARADGVEVEEPRTKMASPGLMGGGIALAALGATAMPFGIIMAMIHSVPDCPGAVGGCGSSGPDPVNVVGWSIIAGGTALVIGGITMIVLGARRVPFDVGANGLRVRF